MMKASSGLAICKKRCATSWSTAWIRVPPVNLDGHQPAVVLLVGVNGSGKTTTAAKLGKQFRQQGKQVLLAAADTYRAAAVDQLQVWGDRLNLPVIAGQPNADPGAVAYDAVQAGLSRQFDIVLVDTAGRLHTRFNLMEELKKVHRVVGKALPGAPHAVWLVLDATTGQNAIHAGPRLQRRGQGERRHPGQARFLRARRHGLCHSTRTGPADPVCRTGRKTRRSAAL